MMKLKIDVDDHVWVESSSFPRELVSFVWPTAVESQSVLALRYFRKIYIDLCP